MEGEPDGAGEVLPAKHLYMFRWSPPAVSVPAHPPPPDVDMRWLSAAACEQAASLLPHPQAVLSQRFAEDSRCLVMHRRDTGELVYHVWVSTVGAWTDWIGGRVEPPQGHGLVFDLWAHPDWRRGRLHLPGAAAVARSRGELGLYSMVAGVEEHEIVPYARMYARAGLGFIVPYEVIVWHRDGPEPWHDTRRPEAHLLESCAAIRRRYEEP